VLSTQRRRAVLHTISVQFLLDWHGVHGVPHWARVRWNGLALAKQNGARRDVVELFALLHDSRRRDDGRDRHHGARAADYVLQLNREVLRLDRPGLEQLAYACRHHSDGLMEADVTVQTCWDADRLDLARVGIRPSPQHLCTAAARDPVMLERAIRRSLRVPGEQRRRA
jgi:uncharacterized protein